MHLRRFITYISQRGGAEAISPSVASLNGKCDPVISNKSSAATSEVAVEVDEKFPFESSCDGNFYVNVCTG